MLTLSILGGGELVHAPLPLWPPHYYFPSYGPVIAYTLAQLANWEVTGSVSGPNLSLINTLYHLPSVYL